jgi:hypothetical protein
MSGYAFYENTIVNATTGVLLGGGRRNHIHDNVFLSNDKDVAFDDRGLTWQQTTCRQNCTHAYPPGSTSCFYNAPWRPSTTSSRPTRRATPRS